MKIVPTNLDQLLGPYSSSNSISGLKILSRNVAQTRVARMDQAFESGLYLGLSLTKCRALFWLNLCPCLVFSFSYKA